MNLLSIRKKIPAFLTALLLCIIAALVTFSSELYKPIRFYSPKQQGDPEVRKETPPIQHRKTKLFTNRDTVKSNNQENELSTNIQWALASQPFDGDGVNTAASKHHQLSKQQVSDLSKIAKQTRTKIASLIQSKLVEIEDKTAGERVFVYEPDPSTYALIRDELHNSIERIAGSDFADKSLQSLITDSRFFEGGRNAIRLIHNPTHIEDENCKHYFSKGIPIVGFEMYNSNGNRISSGYFKTEDWNKQTNITIPLQ